MRCAVTQGCANERIQASLSPPRTRKARRRRLQRAQFLCPRAGQEAGVYFRAPSGKGTVEPTRVRAAHGHVGSAESRPGSAGCLGAAGPFTWQDPAARIPRRSRFGGCCRIPDRAGEASSSIPPSDLSELLAPAVRCGSGRRVPPAGPWRCVRRRRPGGRTGRSDRRFLSCSCRPPGNPGGETRSCAPPSKVGTAPRSLS